MSQVQTGEKIRGFFRGCGLEKAPTPRRPGITLWKDWNVGNSSKSKVSVIELGAVIKVTVQRYLFVGALMARH